jgi:hypothetical protein
MPRPSARHKNAFNSDRGLLSRPIRRVTNADAQPIESRLKGRPLHLVGLADLCGAAKVGRMPNPTFKSPPPESNDGMSTLSPTLRVHELLCGRTEFFVRCRGCRKVRPVNLVNLARSFGLDQRAETFLDRMLCASCNVRQADLVVRDADTVKVGFRVARIMGRKTRR